MGEIHHDERKLPVAHELEIKAMVMAQSVRNVSTQWEERKEGMK